STLTFGGGVCDFATSPMPGGRSPLSPLPATISPARFAACPPLPEAIRFSSARKIWAKPAKTLTDVLLRSEIALDNENGVMDVLDNPDAYYEDRANAQLIRAVLDVLGGLHAL